MSLYAKVRAWYRKTDDAKWLLRAVVAVVIAFALTWFIQVQGIGRVADAPTRSAQLSTFDVAVMTVVSKTKNLAEQKWSGFVESIEVRIDEWSSDEWDIE